MTCRHGHEYCPVCSGVNGPTDFVRALIQPPVDARCILVNKAEYEALTAERDSLVARAESALLSGMDNLAGNLKSLTAENAALSARVEALEGAIGSYVLSSIRVGALDNLMQILNSTPAADLAAHDERVKREALEQAWERVWESQKGDWSEDSTYAYEVKAAVLGTETQEGKK